MDGLYHRNLRLWIGDVTMNLKLISCEIFYREMCAAVARSPNRVDVEFLPKGLHDIGSAEMRATVQETLDKVDGDSYEAVVFGYGLCNNGLHHIESRSLPIVLPRAHDCITLFFGSKEKYLDYFQNNLGVYFKTTGWIERGKTEGDLRQLSIPHAIGMDQSYEELVEQYGEDNAQYIYETLCDTTPHYSKYAYIGMGSAPDARYGEQVRAEAEEKGWEFEWIRGDCSLIQRLIDGDWNEKDFLVVPPGWRVVAKHDEGVVAAEKIG